MDRCIVTPHFLCPLLLSEGISSASLAFRCHRLPVQQILSPLSCLAAMGKHATHAMHCGVPSSPERLSRADTCMLVFPDLGGYWHASFLLWLGSGRSLLVQGWGTPVPEMSHLLAPCQRRTNMWVIGPGHLAVVLLGMGWCDDAWEGGVRRLFVISPSMRQKHLYPLVLPISR